MRSSKIHKRKRELRWKIVPDLRAFPYNMPKRRILNWSGSMTKRIERLEINKFASLRLLSRNIVDTEDFGGRLAANIRNHRILEFCVIHGDGLRCLMKQIYRRRTSQPQRFCRDTQFQDLMPLGPLEALHHEGDFNA